MLGGMRLVISKRAASANRLLLASLAVTASGSFAAGRVTLNGRVTDRLGKPLEDATVMIYHAGVKQGYSTYCPSATRTVANVPSRIELVRSPSRASIPICGSSYC